jgi:hypothetical protein
MTNERVAPVGHQAPSAKDIAGVLVLFRWMGYSSAEANQKAYG